MGRSKELFMQMQEEELNKKENTNQINNNMTKKTMTDKLNGTAYKVETKKEALRRLYLENGLTEEDIYNISKVTMEYSFSYMFN